MQLNRIAVEDLMVHAGLNNRMLARVAGLSESYLCELLKGDKPGTAPTWKKLADALGVRVRTITEPISVAA